MPPFLQKYLGECETTIKGSRQNYRNFVAHIFKSIFVLKIFVLWFEFLFLSF